MNAIDERKNEWVSKTKCISKYVASLGSILINSDPDMGSFTSTKRFDSIDLDTNERKSVLNKIA